MPPANTGATAARRAAVYTLESCRNGRIFEQALDEAARGLDERDRRLAHELAAGVLRRQGALDALLTPLVSRDWEAVPLPLRDILRLGAYQLTSLDRVPAHAAVGTSVTLARESSGARAAGFVNAVLRRLSAQALARADDAGEPPADLAGSSPTGTATELAARFSHPLWLVERWVTHYGFEETVALLEWNDTRPRLAVQPARDSTTELSELWQRKGLTVESAPYGNGLYVDIRRPDQLPRFQQGGFLVQDHAQSMVTAFAGFERGTIYDACAAPGGKTLALGRGGARVIAGDRNRLRVRRVRQNIGRAGSGREFPLVADALQPPIRAVDAVLLDAPCLGTGTFARHPDARWRVTADALKELVERQEAMLEALALLVKPGGMLVYATCSLEPEENECQVDAFLNRHPEFHREANLEIPPELVTPRGDLAILPHRHQMDGAFAARLRRSDR
ncbi:MAG: transcription antitermination factor NusB [Gemmatimonadota bacterium]